MVLTAAFLTLGCSAPSYVNIPPQPGDLARGNPNAKDVREIMALAVDAAVQRERLDGAFEVLLPEGADQITYEKVVLRVGGGAITPDTLRDAPVPTIRVVAVRVRSRDAEVDVARPSPTGRESVTVFLYWYYGSGWAVERVRPWRVAPEKLFPAPGATPAPAAPGGMAGAPAPADAPDAAVVPAPVAEQPAAAPTP